MTIQIFGDSIAYGYNDNIFGGWVNQLQDFCDLNKLGHEIKNHSIPGETTDSLIFHFQKEAEAQRPDLIIFALGVNDSRYYYYPTHPETPKNTFQQNLKLLIKISKQLTNKAPLFIGLTNCDETYTNHCQGAPGLIYSNNSIKQYNQLIKEEATTNYIEIPTLEIPNDFSDGLHPSTEGHRKIFQQIKTNLLNNKLL